MSDPIITNQRQLRSDPKDTLDLLGTILDEDAKRDAVHVAVIPVVAGVTLHPCWSVYLTGNTAYYSVIGGPPSLGIVDPFLTVPVEVGQRFFLFLYPRKISSLRHVWTHPEIPDEAGPELQRFRDRQESEAWLRHFIEDSGISPTYEEVIARAAERINDTYRSEPYAETENLHFGEDASGSIPLEFWDHVEVVTGQRIPRENRAVRFSCAC